MPRYSALPPRWTRDSVDALLAEHGSGGCAAYLPLLLLVVGCLAALPLVEVPVTARSQGVVRPAVEKHEIRAPRDAAVLEIAVRPNDTVLPGATLARLDAPGLTEREAALRTERESLEPLVRDLERLTRADSTGPPSGLETSRYRRAWRRHAHSRSLQRSRLELARQELKRTGEMVALGVAPLVELEEVRARTDREHRSAAMLEEDVRIGWETELLELRTRLDRLEAEAAAVRADRQGSEVTAPVGGTVEYLAALSPGSRVRSGDLLAVVSPDTTLVGMAYPDARVAALVEPGAVARLEIEAFPSAEWGVVAGTVTDVAADAISIDGIGAYPVTIRLHRDHLTLPGGRRGYIRKGMAFQARFTLARRSLWALLRDDIDDWLSPAAGGG